MPELETIEQFLPLFDPNNEHYYKRYLTWYGGRGGRKSWEIARGLLLRGQREPKKILCTREYQNSIDESVWAVLESQAHRLGVNDFYEFQNSAIYGKNGTKFIFKGLRQNINSIKSFEDVDIVWNEEAQSTSQKSIDVLYPTIRKPGSQIITSYNTTNPTDPIYIETVQNHDPDEAYLCKVNYLDNPDIDEAFIRRALKVKEKDLDAYNHIYLGDFDTRHSGSVYAKYVNQQQVSEKVIHDPNYPVYTAWDLGYDDSTAIWFFQVGINEVFIIDYYETNGEDLKHYAEACYGRQIIVDERDADTGEVIQWSFGEDIPEFAHRKDYNYHAHYGPHDAGNKVIQAGGRSILSQAQKLGMNFFVIPQTSRAQSREAARQTLPICWINKKRCADGLHAVMSYKFEYDDDRQVFKKEELHDWSSHGSNALEILGRTWKDTTQPRTQKQIERKKVHDNFHRLRHEHGMVKEDPYRLKPMRKK